jgi:L-threonylcarbamoyladenylate synthase
MIGTSVAVAARWLEKDNVVAIPTETVYGLAGNIFSEKAICQIYTVKKRPFSNPLIVHVADLSQAMTLITGMPATAQKLAEAFWPGSLTLILPKNRNVPGLVTAGQDSVAIRIPDHPLALALLKEVRFPLAAPSANPFNYISPVTATAVDEMLGEQIPYILDGGPSTRGIESTIITFEGERVQLLRPGAITEEQISEVINEPLLLKENITVAHPGMFSKHYSPRTPVMLTDDIRTTASGIMNLKIALLTFCDEYPLLHAARKIILSPARNTLEAARNLYAALYQLDKEKYDLIIAEKMPDEGMGKAINDRLMKAATPS